MNNPSVIICNYNLLPQLEAVAIALREFHVDFELILSDDHSDDGSVEWAEKSKLFDQIYVKPVREDFSINTIRNEGIQLASSETVILLDSSNIPSANFFTGHQAVLDAFEDVLSIGLLIRCDAQNTETLHNRKVISQQKTFMSVMPAGVQGGNMAFTKALWEKVGKFDEKFNGSWGWDDNDFAIRVLIHGGVVMSHSDSLAIHLEHEITWSREPQGKNLELLKSKFGSLLSEDFYGYKI